MDREGWEPACDDEPRTDGKSALDLFSESCQTADAQEAARKKRWPYGIVPWEEREAETLDRFRQETAHLATWCL
jgi:hypothetical protein